MMSKITQASKYSGFRDTDGKEIYGGNEIICGGQGWWDEEKKEPYVPAIFWKGKIFEREGKFLVECEPIFGETPNVFPLAVIYAAQKKDLRIITD